MAGAGCAHRACGSEAQPSLLNRILAPWSPGWCWVPSQSLWVWGSPSLQTLYWSRGDLAGVGVGVGVGVLGRHTVPEEGLWYLIRRFILIPHRVLGSVKILLVLGALQRPACAQAGGQPAWQSEFAAMTGVAAQKVSEFVPGQFMLSMGSILRKYHLRMCAVLVLALFPLHCRNTWS